MQASKGPDAGQALLTCVTSRPEAICILFVDLNVQSTTKKGSLTILSLNATMPGNGQAFMRCIHGSKRANSSTAGHVLVSSIRHRPCDWVEGQKHVVNDVHNGCAAGPQVCLCDVRCAPYALDLHRTDMPLRASTAL